MADIKILLVEDENIEALDIKRTLESFGYQVPYVASYGEEAIQKAHEINPDIILMDIVLKGKINGIDAASEIKKLSIPIIFLTAHSEDSTIERAKLTEPYGYVIKPFEPMNLKNAIDLAIFKSEMEQKLKEIIQGSPIPQFVIDKDHRVIYWNKALEEYSGIDLEEVIGTKNHWKAFYDEERPCMVDLLLDDSLGAISQWYEGKFNKSELLEGAYEATDFFPKVGAEGKWLYFTAALIRNSRGEIIGGIETLEDVTRRKAAELELKKSEARYRKILENIQDAYFQSDLDGKIIMASPSAAEIYRYDSPDDMIGINAEFLYKNVEDRVLLMEKLQKQGNVGDFEGEGQRKDGTTFWASLNAQYYHNEQGQIQGIEAFVRDITERKTAENRINKLYRLYATLSQINQAVVRVNDRDTLYKTICQVCVDFGKFRMAWIGLIDPETGYVIPAEHCGYEEGYLEKFSLNIYDEQYGDHPTIKAINKGKFIVIENIQNELNESWSEEALKRNYHSFAAIPLKLKGKVIATLNIYSSESDFFTDEEIDLIKEMALDISFALDSIELQKEREGFEKALTESERNYRELVDHSLVAIYKTTLDGEIIFANESMAKIFHYDDVEELKSVNIKKMYKNFEDRDAFISKVEKEGFITDHELEIVGKDGKTVNVLVSSSLVQGVLTGMFMDITGRKKAEEALKLSEEKFRALIFNSTDLIRILDKDGLVVFDSPSSERILGYPTGYFIGKSPLDFVHPDDRDKVKNDLGEVYQKTNPGTPTEFRILRADGEYLPVESISQNMMDVPGINGVVVTTHPIKERKIMEEALRDSEEKYRTLFESDPDYTVLVGLDGVILDVNSATMDFTGLSRSELIGNNFSQLYLFPQDETALQLENFSRAIRSHTVQAFQCRIFNKEGGNSWIESKLVPLEKDGQIHSILVIATDITDKKIATDRLESSLKEKEVLLKEIHHRVKNNMQIISSLLNLQTQHVQDDEIVDLLKESQNRVKSMAMIHEKLYQSKDFTNIKFKDYIGRLISELFYSYNVDPNQIKSVIVVEDVLLNIETAVPCGLIISELVSNSLKHAFPQGRKGELKVLLKLLDDKYELTISDNGVGFPKDLDYQNTESLGLQLVNSLIIQIDGAIELNKNHGTEFKISFRGLKYKERY